MDYFGQFQTDFVQLWSNVGHIWPFLDRKFALRLFQNTETAFRACFFVMEITFSMEKFPHSAVGFRSKDQAASRARIFSWSDVSRTCRGFYCHRQKAYCLTVGFNVDSIFFCNLFSLN